MCVMHNTQLILIDTRRSVALTTFGHKRIGVYDLSSSMPHVRHIPMSFGGNSSCELSEEMEISAVLPIRRVFANKKDDILAAIDSLRHEGCLDPAVGADTMQ